MRVSQRGMLFLAVLALVCGGGWRGRTAASPGPAQPYWVLIDSELRSLIDAGLAPSMAQYFFNTPHTLIIEPSGRNRSTPVVELPRASLVETFDSEADLASAVTRNALYPNIKYVGYNAHFWVWKNSTEQQNLIKTAQVTAAIAHQHGLGFFFAIPAIIAPHLAVAPSGDKFTDYLNENLAARGAAVSDVFEIESQDLQNDSGAFRAFAGRAIAQARAGNPHIPVLLGLTTYARRASYSARSMLDAYTATRGEVDGYWINGVNNGAAQEAVAFLQALYAARHGSASPP
jgi:hypothetical protein